MPLILFVLLIQMDNFFQRLLFSLITRGYTSEKLVRQSLFFQELTFRVVSGTYSLTDQDVGEGLEVIKDHYMVGMCKVFSFGDEVLIASLDEGQMILDVGQDIFLELFSFLVDKYSSILKQIDH